MLKKLNFIYVLFTDSYIYFDILLLALQTYTFFLFWHKLCKKIKLQIAFYFSFK